jgi:hypothetical protein
MGDLLGSLVRRNQKRAILCRLKVGRCKWYQSHCPVWDGGVCTSLWELPAVSRWDANNGMIPWGSPAGTLDPKRGWLWRPTSPGYENDDMFICIFAHFLTQHFLKPWWPWMYQNSVVKRAYARVVPGWVTSREVWFGRVKSRQYCVIGDELLQHKFI